MIGAGARATYAHYPSLAEMPDVEMAAICELNLERMKAVGDKYGIHLRYTDYRKMLEEVALDAVYIIMGPEFLDPIVTYCLKKDKNVFIEKPPGTTVEETRKWAKLAKEHGCKTAVGFQRVFHPLVREAKRILEERGRIIHCMAAFHKYGEWQGYFDSLTNDVIHIIALLRWLGGDVKKVHSLSGQFYSNIGKHLNLYTAILEFKSGGIGILHSNRVSGGRVLYFEAHSKGISVYGDIPGIAGVDHLKVVKDNQPYEEARVIRNEDIIGSNVPYTHIDGTFQVNRHFIDCIKRDEEPLTNFEDSVKTMKIVRAILSGPRLPPVA